MVPAFYEKMGKNERLLLLVASSAIFLFMVDLVLRPIMSQLSVLDAEIDAKTEMVRKDYRVLSFKESILGEGEKYKLYFVDKGKTQEELMSDILRQIEDLARQHMITINNIRPGNLEDNQISKLYSTSLECEGRLRDMLEFMHSMETATHLFQIKAYNFVPKDKTGEVLKCNISLTRTIVFAESV